MKWKNIYRGFAMGVSDVVPGVSGGTIAVLLGFYDQLIASINNLFSKKWKESILFLIPIVIGMGVAIFSLSHLMTWLLEHYNKPTYFFFIGLIIGILPFLFRESNARQTFEWQHYVLMLIGIIIILSLPINPTESTIITDRSFSTLILLFFAGFLASAAMILPGISGSFVMLIIGVYSTIMTAVKNIELLVIFVVGTGIVLGIITMSKVIHYSLKHFRYATFAFIIGLVIGSIFVIFPGFASSIGQLIISFFVFFIGLGTAYILGKVEY